MISIKNLSFAYKNNPLFTGLNLNMGPGNIYGLFGLNGAGKSTLFHIICGLLFPDKGICRITGFKSSKRKSEALRELYLLPEKFDLPDITLSSYVDLYAPFYPYFDRSYYQDLIRTLQVPLNRKTGQISFGQRKKFLISFALATNCKILLMDEPTNGLDIPSKSQFRKIIAAADNTNRCIVISTHQVRDLESMIDHMTVLHEGAIIFQQSISDINRNLETRELLNSYSESESDSKEKSHQILYYEDTMGGREAIIPKNSSHQSSKVDLELLFNGIVQNTKKINSQFK